MWNFTTFDLILKTSLIMLLVQRVSDCFRSFLLKLANRFSQILWISACNSSARVQQWGGGPASLGALYAPLSWVQFALLWIFAGGRPGLPPLLLGGESGLSLVPKNWPSGPTCRLLSPLSPGGNWHILLLIIKATWHVYSPRWADLQCRHIPLFGVSARCPFEASLRLRWLKIPSCYIFLGQ